MNKEWFTYNDGVLLSWLLIAHITTDFIFQTKELVNDKYKYQFKSFFLYIHGCIAAICLWIASGFQLPILLALIAGVLHLLTDAIKISVDKKRNLVSFIIDQLAHLLVVLLIWVWLIKKWSILYKVIYQLITDYKFMLVIVGLIIVVWPASFVIKFFIKEILPKQNTEVNNGSDNEENEKDAENAGRYIGVFERVIILFLVLLNQYQAIGFLITGKSIIRMNSKKQTEYVLMGTLISYAIAICTGICINWLKAFKG